MAPAAPPGDAGPGRGDAAAAPDLDALWQQSRAAIEEQVRQIQSAVAAAILGSLAPPTRKQARDAAHRLAGSLGSFGLPEGTEAARRLEAMLGGQGPLDDASIPGLAEEVARLHSLVQTFKPGASNGTDDVISLLVATDDDRFAGAIERAAAAPGSPVVSSVRLAGLSQGLEAAFHHVVVMDLPDSHGPAEVAAILQEARRAAPFGALVLATARGDLALRVAAAREGAVSVLRRDQPAGKILDGAVRIARGEPGLVRVLVVDDDPAVLSIIRAALTLRGHHVQVLADPRNFWDTLLAATPDVVILDYDMPGYSGADLCRAIRGAPAWRHLPVIAVTAADDPEVIDELFDAGIDDHIAKPVNVDRLVERVERRTDRRGPGQVRAPDPAPPAPDERSFDVALVDDDPVFARFILQLLRDNGLRAVWMQNGLDAIGRLGGDRPTVQARLVLLDINLPGLDGLTILRRLKEQGILRTSRAIMLTARALDEDVIQSFRLGAIDHISKPVNPTLLLAQVRRLMED